MTEQFEQAKREFADKHSSSYRQMMAIEADLNALLEKHKEVMCKKCKHRGLPDSIQEALNSGDGVYRP